MNLLDLETNERKNLSLWMMFGGAVTFTIFAAIGLWLVSANLTYVFYLAVLAHLQVITIMTGFIAQLVKRRVSINKTGISLEDSSDPTTTTTS